MAWIGQIQLANNLHALACLVGAYALGCFGTGYYLVRAQTGRDIREIGSGSLGARNVGRVLGRSGLCVTLLADFAKGGLAVWAARHLTGTEVLTGVALLAVTVGHVWPVQLGFRGGKGVATAVRTLRASRPALRVHLVGRVAPERLEAISRRIEEIVRSERDRLAGR